MGFQFFISKEQQFIQNFQEENISFNINRTWGEQGPLANVLWLIPYQHEELLSIWLLETLC